MATGIIGAQSLFEIYARALPAFAISVDTVRSGAALDLEMKATKPTDTLSFYDEQLGLVDLFDVL